MSMASSSKQIPGRMGPNWGSEATLTTSCPVSNRQRAVIHSTRRVTSLGYARSACPTALRQGAARCFGSDRTGFNPRVDQRFDKHGSLGWKPAKKMMFTTKCGKLAMWVPSRAVSGKAGADAMPCDDALRALARDVQLNCLESTRAGREPEGLCSAAGREHQRRRTMAL